MQPAAIVLFPEVMVDAALAVVRQCLGGTERLKTACGCHSVSAGLNRRSSTPMPLLTVIAVIARSRLVTPVT